MTRPGRVTQGSARRSKLALLGLAALALAFLVSCGRYGPPVRSQPAPPSAGDPAQAPAPDGEAEEAEEEQP